MAKHRSAASRAALLKASRDKRSGGGFTLSGAREMARSISPKGSEFLVREIVAYTVTKIFHAPLAWPTDCETFWVRIPGGTPEYSATLTGKLRRYLQDISEVGQIGKSPSLRETVEKLEKQSGNSSPAYLVVEERGKVSGCRMDRGECWQALDSVGGGVVIFKTTDGAWPTLNDRVEQDTATLAAMRIIEMADHPFEQHTRDVCFVTDRGETAHPLSMGINIAYGGARSLKVIVEREITNWAEQLGENINRLLQVNKDPEVSELLSAIRLDKARDDEYFRLWYLRLWQALVDVGIHGKDQAIKARLELLKTKQRWKDLTEHRVAIAHWWTEKVDYSMVQDLHRFAVEVAGYIIEEDKKGPKRSKRSSGDKAE